MPACATPSPTSSPSRSTRARSRTSPTTAFGDYGPTYAPDGKSIVYLARVSGDDKLFRVDLATGTKTQLTFGTHDDGSAQFLDADTLMFPSTAVDPNQPISPEVAKNGNIYNIWTLNLKTNELKQYTDALGGNVSPVLLKDENKKQQIAFVSYYKGEYSIHEVPAQKEALHTVASADFGAPGPIIDFQPPLSHTLVKENEHVKGKFEKLFLEGRPPVNVGVTSGGDFFGGTSVTFSDVLGDQQFNLYAESVSQYRSFAGSYTNLSRRLQYALQGFSQTQFYYGNYAGVLYDPSLGYLSHSDAVSTATTRGGTAFGIYPLNRYARLELTGGLVHFDQQYNDPNLQAQAIAYQQALYGTTLLANGTLLPLGTAYVRETTVFREYGPLSGDTMRAGYEYAPKIGGFISRQTADLDARKYIRLGTNGVAAIRFRGLKSWGDFPSYLYSGGNSELRGYQYLEFIGNKSFFVDAELRFPIIEAALTPFGVVGGLRGVFFFDIGASQFANTPLTVFSTKSTNVTPIVNYSQDPTDRHHHAGPGHAHDGQRLPSRRRPRVLRPGSRNLCARLPDPLRLVVAHDVQSRVRGLRVRLSGHAQRRLERQHMAAPPEVLGLDRLRLLGRFDERRKTDRRKTERKAERPYFRLPSSVFRLSRVAT